ncbi:nuclease EXOG, mitochondrial isoform X2 [Mauremys reevesii]|uniref:nuclease EXOG, mitochondrial isoform X2 n=1 Tax=Mauremys reevesii TaxID=260615 RepID=UPI00193F56D1|nr:nuclease EXOG, mitochondrial isoform X2 [Mauremys reevesii]
MKTMLGAGGHEDIWHQQEITNFQQKLWLKHFTCPTLCPKITRIMLDSGTGAMAQSGDLELSQSEHRGVACAPVGLHQPWFLSESCQVEDWSMTPPQHSHGYRFETCKALQEYMHPSNNQPKSSLVKTGSIAALRMEMYCRELTERFEDVWIVSGPLTLPQTGDDGKKRVTYQVIGKGDVAVPSHLYKVILAKRSRMSSEPLVLGAFVVPNDPIGFSHQLPEFQVHIEDLEKMSGLVFFPQVDKTKDVKNICDVDTCKLMGFDEFTLYITTRKVHSARTLHRLEKVMSELRETGIEPDEYLVKLYKKKEEELVQQKQMEAREGRAG